MKNAALSLLALVLFLAGCSSSTLVRSGGTALGALAGGAAGYALGHKDPKLAVAGAGLGALATSLAMGKDPAVLQEGFDEGYVRGQSDAIKRQVFLRYSLEERPMPNANEEGKPVYFKVPGPTVTSDGRKLEPHYVVVQTVE